MANRRPNLQATSNDKSRGDGSPETSIHRRDKSVIEKSKEKR